MRTFLSTILILLFLFQAAFATPPERGNNALIVLKKDVGKILQENADRLPENTDQTVTVGFLINASNELIILDVNGDSTSACEYVKQVLNYQKVKYTQAKQLTRYTISIHLVN